MSHPSLAPVVHFVLAGLVLCTLLAACADDPRQPTTPSPTTCGPYPDQSQSPYVLPYPAGASYVVSQGNCTAGSHSIGSQNQYAYDFRMPVGSVIIAVRAGTVTQVVEEFVDGDNTSGHENQVWVNHGDGTAAAYFHLTQNGALVAVGDTVVAGQHIALSGNTGASTEPHLHFAIVRSGPGSTPATFSNTRPHPNGLVQGEAYTAQ